MPILTEEAMFEETMRELLKTEPGDFELGPLVSSEKQYRMPDEGRVKRRPVSTTNDPARSSGGEKGGPKKYNLLPPPMPRSKPLAHDPNLTFEL